MLTLTLGAAAIVFSQPARAAVDSWFCVPTVTGTCLEAPGTPARADGWIQVSAIAYGAANRAPEGDPYAPGEGSLGPIEVLKAVDETSPTWFLTALQGTPVDLHFAWRRSGALKGTSPYMRITYTGVTLTVSQYQQSGDDPHQQRLTFENPDAILFRYWKQKSDGTMVTPPLTTTWPSP